MGVQIDQRGRPERGGFSTPARAAALTQRTEFPDQELQVRALFVSELEEDALALRSLRIVRRIA